MKIRTQQLLQTALMTMAVLAMTFGMPPLVCAQDEIETRAYSVKDILIGVNNYSFQGITLPGTQPNGGGFPSGGFGGGSMGSGGLRGGGGGGGGVFAIPDQLNTNISFRQVGGGGGTFGGGSSGGDGGFYLEESEPVTLGDIESTISQLVEMADPDAWSEGGMQTLGGSTLIVTTTAANHERVQRHLDMIRKVATGTARSVTISVTWLSITDAQYLDLADKPENGVMIADREKLMALAEESGSFGTITCFDGQTVHLVSGEKRNQIQTVSPVVGMSEAEGGPSSSIANLLSEPGPVRSISSRSQVPGAAGPNNEAGGIGYKPITEMFNEGALLQLTPVILADRKEALLDVHSNIVLPINVPAGAGHVDFQGVIKLDRQHVRSQQFDTSLRLPLEKPVIVGGSTVQVGNASAWYLVLELHAGE